MAAVEAAAAPLSGSGVFLKKVFSVQFSSTKLGLPMLRDRRHRLITVLLALVSLLFMQLAVAGYICPGAGSKMAEAAAMADAGMPCAESMPLHMDEEQPGLCHAHCQAGQASVDKHESPPPAPIGALPPDFTIPVIVKSFSEAPLQAPDLRRTTAPPLSIRNCCFRL